MKIIDSVLLSEGQTGLELDSWPTVKEQRTFYRWAKENDLRKFVKFKNFYRAEFMGDVDYPAIQVKKDAPEQVITLTLLRWS